MFISLEKKLQQKSKQIYLYEKLTKAKSNFDSNWILSKLWFKKAIYIYIYGLGLSCTWCNFKQCYTTQKFLIGCKYWQIHR